MKLILLMILRNLLELPLLSAVLFINFLQTYGRIHCQLLPVVKSDRRSKLKIYFTVNWLACSFH